VPWLRRLVTAFSQRRPGLNPRPVIWRMWWTRCHLHRLFLRANLFSRPAPSHQWSVSVLPSSTIDDIYSLQITLLNNHLSLGPTHSPSLSFCINAVSTQARLYFISLEDYWWLWTTPLQASIKIFFSSINMWRLILRCALQHMKVIESV